MSGSRQSLRDRILHDLPVEPRTADIGGMETVVLEGGDGPPLILLHGGIQVGGVVWWRVVSELAQTNRLVTPDLPGIGESPPMAQPVDTPGVVAWLRGLVETTDRSPLLVAHSLLGVFAMRYAMEYGDQLRRLVLVSTPGLGSFRPKPSVLRALLLSMVRPNRGTLNRFMSRVLYDLDGIEEALGDRWQAFIDYLTECATTAYVRQTMKRIPRGNLAAIADDELRTIKTPTALIWGKDDPNTRLATAERAIEVTGWPLHVLEKTGHIPHLERPDLFIAELRSGISQSQNP